MYNKLVVIKVPLQGQARLSYRSIWSPKPTFIPSSNRNPISCYFNIMFTNPITWMCFLFHWVCNWWSCSCNLCASWSSGLRMSRSLFCCSSVARSYWFCVFNFAWFTSCRASSFIRRRIKQLCDERGITINKLSTICGITQSTQNNIFTRENNKPTVSTVKKNMRWIRDNAGWFF